MSKTGLLFVISGPSGVGKGTVIKRVRELEPNIHLSISCTTRPPREGERHEEHYFFISEDEFLRRAQTGKFFEYAIVHASTSYGTPVSEIDKCKEGRDVFLEIDVQGALKARKKKPDLVSVFIAPPSVEELEKRLRGRNTESEEKILKRMSTAMSEIKRMDEYDYIVENADVETCARDILEIIEMEHKKQTGRELALKLNEHI